MKKLIIAAVISSTLTTATVANDNPTPHETCTAYHGFAEAAMRARQSGVPMPKLIEVAGDEELLVIIIREAFDHPRMQVEKNKQRYITDFANNTYAECLQAFD